MAQADSEANSETPPPLSDDESLARAVTDRTEANFAKRNRNKPKAATYIHPGSFTHYGRNKLSVDRYSHMDPGDAVARGKEMARNRGPGRQFHGWALLSRSDVTSIGFDAEASPEGGHFWHADIILPDDAATGQEAHNHYAAELARVATWLERPS